jgi:non-ribosomal peptide synthetase component F
MALKNYDHEPFPLLPPSVKDSRPDSVEEHQFSRPKGQYHDISLSTLICAAWALVSSRMANSKDSVFGVILPQTIASDADKQCNTKPTKLACASTTALVTRVTVATNLSMLEYLEAIYQESTSGCAVSRSNDEFQTLLVLHLTEEKCNRILKKWQGIYPALTLEFIPVADDRMVAKAKFDQRVISSWKIRKLLERLDFVFQQLLVASPQSTLADLNMVTSQDLCEIWDWNSKVPQTIERCVHTMFEEWVNDQPNAPAVCAWDGDLTYVEMDSLATKLARKLIELEVGSGIVPLCFHKSMWMTVAIFAVMKSGAAFLLLDPSLPEKRLQYMVRQVKAKAVLSSLSAQSLSQRLAENVVTVEPALFENLSGGNWAAPYQSPSSLMYVTFTSGSTGEPKCVKTTHSNVASALYHQIKSMGFSKTSRVLDFASYSFTTAISNVCGALAAGMSKSKLGKQSS